MTRKASSGKGRIAIACALSLSVHGLLLLAVRAPQASVRTRPALVLQVVAVAAPVAPAAMAAPAPREAEGMARSQPARKPPPAPLPPTDKPPVPPAPEATFHPADTLEQAPRPQSRPAIPEHAPELVARRLVVNLWIAADGTVARAEVPLNEVSAEVARQLEEAVAGLRFTPGRLAGRWSAAAWQTRLCFDDAGRLEAPTEECWPLEPEPSR